jgi:uncharacterized protein YabN with tetrapyrrole methylase and pyrophosphatase domain
MAAEPDLYLAGFGTGSGLELSLEAESALRRIGFAMSINAPPALVRHLHARGVELQALDELLTGDEPWADRILGVADAVLRQLEFESPVAVLVPDNPLFLNPLSRFLVAECRVRGKTVATLAGVSQFDAVVNALGLDIGRRGLGLVDAASAAETWPMPLSSPVVVFKVAALAADGGLSRLAARMRAIYPEDHEVTLVNVAFGEGATSHATLPLSRFEEFESRLGPGACLYLGPAA